jgi:hypothetical protein
MPGMPDLRQNGPGNRPHNLSTFLANQKTINVLGNVGQGPGQQFLGIGLDQLVDAFNVGKTRIPNNILWFGFHASQDTSPSFITPRKRSYPSGRRQYQDLPRKFAWH